MSVNATSIRSWLQEEHARDFARALAEVMSRDIGVPLVIGEVIRVGQPSRDGKMNVELAIESCTSRGKITVGTSGAGIKSVTLEGNSPESIVTMNFELPKLPVRAADVFANRVRDLKRGGKKFPEFIN